MKKVLLIGSLLLILGGSVQAAPLTPDVLPYLDFDCNRAITVADVLHIPPRIGSRTAVDRWAYDLDRDGAITLIDVQIAALELGREDLPTPPWCMANGGRYE